MPRHNWPLINRLKRAVKKIKFIITFNDFINKFKIATLLNRSSSSSTEPPRRLSFNDRPLGLKAATSKYWGCSSSFTSSSASSLSRDRELHRTSSCPMSDDDVDKRAEAFIANFYRQLKMERQISLQLRYCRGDSFGSVISP